MRPIVLTGLVWLIACGDPTLDPLVGPDSGDLGPHDGGRGDLGEFDGGRGDLGADDMGPGEDLHFTACTPAPDALPRTSGVRRLEDPGLRILVLERDFGPPTDTQPSLLVRAAGQEHRIELPPSGCVEGRARALEAPVDVVLLDPQQVDTQRDVPLGPIRGAELSFSLEEGLALAPTVEVFGRVELADSLPPSASALQGFTFTASKDPFTRIPGGQPTRADGSSARQLVLTGTEQVLDYRLVTWAPRFEGITALFYRVSTGNPPEPVYLGLARLSGGPSGSAELDVPVIASAVPRGEVRLGPATLAGGQRSVVRLVDVPGDPELSMWTDPAFVDVGSASGVSVGLWGTDGRGPFANSRPALLVYESQDDSTYSYRIHRDPPPGDTVPPVPGLPTELSVDATGLRVRASAGTDLLILEGWDAEFERRWVRVSARPEGSDVSVRWPEGASPPGGRGWLRVLALSLPEGDEPDGLDRFARATAAAQRWFELRD